MTAWNKEQALARSIELHEKRFAEFDQLLDVERRVAHGDYEFFSRVDIELRELEQEAPRNGFVLEWNWDGQDFIYTMERMSPEDLAAFLAEEQEECCWNRLNCRSVASTSSPCRKNVFLRLLWGEQIDEAHAGLSYRTGSQPQADYGL